LADDLDWNAIIAPGNDAARRGGSDGSDEPAQPMTRREARERRDAIARARAAAAAPNDAAPLDADAPARATSVDAPLVAREQPDAPLVAREQPTAQHDVHPDVHALLGPASPAAQHDDAARSGQARNGGSGTDGSGVGGSGAGGPGSGGGGRDGRGRGGRPSRPPREPRRKRSKVAITVGIILVLVVVGGGIGGYAFAAPKVQALIGKITGKSDQVQDYTGSGTGKVTVTIKEGDIGSDVATTLHREDVTASYDAFYKLLLASPNIQFQPGSYSLKKHMSAKSALAALQNSKNKIQASIVIPEGEVLKDVEATMVQKTGLSAADIAAAAKDTSSYALPSGVTSLEGYLFPATYPVNPGWTAKQYFASMVDTMNQHLDAAGVPAAQREHVVIFASLVQKEAGLAADFPKVARVFQNRIDQGMPLQSDATVAYGTGHTDKVTTTDAEREDASDPYNTYKHLGLPPGPISNPGDVAINAVMHPSAGSWLYFVTVNLQTGQTVFSDTYAEHQQAVAQFQAWLRAHPSYQ
jgi:uncharacterized YceG family protein